MHMQSAKSGDGRQWRGTRDRQADRQSSTTTAGRRSRRSSSSFGIICNKSVCINTGHERDREDEAPLVPVIQNANKCKAWTRGECGG